MSEKYKYGEIAKKYIKEFDNNFPQRITGTKQEKLTARFIISELNKLGYTAKKQIFSFTDNNKIIKSANIIAEKTNTISSKQIIIGAHYDTSPDSSTGADDNASGVGIVLELASILKNIEILYNIKFIFFGAEESGFIGSKHYVQKMRIKEKKSTILMINFDTLLIGDYLYVYSEENGLGAKIRDKILNHSLKNNLNIKTQQGENPLYPYGTTGDFNDHVYFKLTNIPFIHFEATNWELGEKDGYTQTTNNYGVEGKVWHTKFDNLKYIEENFSQRMNENLNASIKATMDLFININDYKLTIG